MKNKFKDSLPLVLMILFTYSCATKKTTTNQEVKSTSNRMSEKFVKGFNSGDPDSLTPIVSDIFTNQFLESNGTDRRELYGTYGPLANSFTYSSSTPTIVWYKGKISNGWVGFQFHLDSISNKSRRLTNWRARPVEFPVELKTEKAVIDSLEQYLNELTDANLFDGTVTLSHKGTILLNDIWGLDKKEVPNECH